MGNTASVDLIRALARDTGGPHASVFFPEGADEPRVEGLLREARATFRDYGWPDWFLTDPSADEPVMGRRRASALFSAPGWQTAFPVPFDLRGQVVIGEAFHVKPVLPLLALGRRFHVLALSGEGVKLFEGSRERLRPVEDQRLTAAPSQVLAYDRLAKQRQFHVAGHAGSHGRVVAHGQGIGGEIRKEHLHQYLVHIARALPALVPSGEPLVLAGVGYLQSMFRHSWPRAIPESVLGNVEHMPMDELHSRAVECVRHEEARREQAAVDGFRALRGTDLAVTRLGTVLQAAQQGRVETVWVAVDQECWGSSSDPNTCEPQQRNGTEDLLNLTACRTLLSGGSVHAVPCTEVPEGGPVAAVLRY